MWLHPTEKKIQFPSSRSYDGFCTSTNCSIDLDKLIAYTIDDNHGFGYVTINLIFPGEKIEWRFTSMEELGKNIINIQNKEQTHK